MSAKQHAWENAREHEKLVRLAKYIHDFEGENGRSPTVRELNNCGPERTVCMFFIFIEKNPQGDPILRYDKPSVPFSPRHVATPSDYILNMKTGEFSHAGSDEFWEVFSKYALEMTLYVLMMLPFLIGLVKYPLKLHETQD